MGVVGRLAATAGGYIAFGPWGALAGSFIGSMVFTMPQPSVVRPQQDVPMTGANDGFQSTTVSGNVPVPVCFGSCMVFGNIVKGYLLGDNNNRMLCAVALAEHLGNPDPVLMDVWVGDKRITELSNYSGSRADDATWFEFYPDGSGTTVNVTNVGRKMIGQVLSDGEEFVSYAIEVLGTADVTVDINHYSPAAGSQQSWSIHYKNGDDGEWQLLGSYSQFFRKEVVYEVPDSCGGTDTKVEYVEGYTRTSHSFTGLKGELYFRVTLTSATNGGNILWEDVNITSDTGADVPFTFPGTTFLLVNLVRTPEITSQDFKILANFGRDNPAAAIRFLLEDRDRGLGMGSEIDMVSFDDAAVWCNLNGRSCHVCFSNIHFDQAVGMLLQAAGLILIKTGGVFKLVPDKASLPVTTIDTSTDVLPGSFSFGAKDYQKRWNRLRCKYIDSQENYTEQDLLIEDTAQLDHDRALREATVDLTPINSMGLAQQRLTELFNQSVLNNIWVKFAVGIRMSRLEPGDVFTLVNDDIGWTAAADKRFRVISMDEIVDENGKFGYQISAELHDPAAYLQNIVWDAWHPDPWQPPATEGNALAPVMIDSISHDVIPNGALSQCLVTVAYTVPSDPTFSHVELWAASEVDDRWHYAGDDNSGFAEWIVPESWIWWKFALVAVDSNGRKTDLTTAPFSLYYPETSPVWSPGFGGGRYGAQPYGA